MFKFLVLLLLPVSIYATELKQCSITNIKIENVIGYDGMSHEPKPLNRYEQVNTDGELLFSYNIKMNRVAIDGAIQLGWSRLAPNCGKFYDDVATFIVLNYDESGVSQYKLNHSLSF